MILTLTFTIINMANRMENRRESDFGSLPCPLCTWKEKVRRIQECHPTHHIIPAKCLHWESWSLHTQLRVPEQLPKGGHVKVVLLCRIVIQVENRQQTSSSRIWPSMNCCDIVSTEPVIKIQLKVHNHSHDDLLFLSTCGCLSCVNIHKQHCYPPSNKKKRGPSCSGGGCLSTRMGIAPHVKKKVKTLLLLFWQDLSAALPPQCCKDLQMIIPI